MKFFRLDLLTLLISLFILNSCKNQDSVGLGINSSNQIKGILTDSSTVVINTVLEDSLITSGAQKNSLGYFNDPLLGITQSDIATNLNLPGNIGFTLPTGTITLDSARLILAFADGFYGDSIASSYTVNVFQLNDKYNESISYYNTKHWQYNPANLVGSLTFNSRTHDSVKINHIIVGKPDVVNKVSAEIRIPINSTFINSSFFYAGSVVLATNATFQNNLKGLFITLDKTKTTGAGGIFRIKADTLAVYYKVTNGAKIDTAVANLIVTSSATQIQHAYSTVVQTELNNAPASGNVVYLQGLAGLRAKISFPKLLANLRNDLLSRDSDIVLNHAELVVTPNPGSTIPFSPAPKLIMYRLDIAHQRFPLEDNSASDPRSSGVSSFVGRYSKITKQYHFILTAYLQDLLLKRTVDYGAYIAPVDTSSISKGVNIYANPPQTAARTVAIGSDKSSPYRVKLNIIYTKVSK